MRGLWGDGLSQDRALENREEVLYALRSLLEASDLVGVDRGRFSSRSRQVREVWWLVLSQGVGGPQAGREVGRPERFL